MRKQSSNIILILTGAMLFNLLFWQEKLAINTVIFDTFILLALFRTYPGAITNTTVKWLLVGHVICLTMLVFQNTSLSKIAFSITLLLIVGFSEYVHRSVFYAGGSVLMNFVFVAAGFFEKPGNKNQSKNKKGTFIKIIRFSIFPILLALIFLIIYNFANTILSNLISKLGLSIEQFFSKFFELFSVQRIAFLIFGFYITGSLLIKAKLNYFSQREALQQDDLNRKRISLRRKTSNVFYQVYISIMGNFGKGMMALKNANALGIVSLVLLNLLLLVVNIIDITYVWFNFNYNDSINMTAMVHEGTGFLIVSILMAMAVVLFFFKGNLNFYQKNKWLKYGAYLWIFQNTILVISVFMRDYYYIVNEGLAYKRIGVLFFLLMVVIGLLTVTIKIYRKKTSYYLFRVNAWAAIIILILSTSVNWDQQIATYNLKHKETIPLDVSFLLTLSDKTLPLLDQNFEAIKRREAEVKKPDTNESGCGDCFTQILKERENKFMDDQQKYTWLSWNYSDESVKKYFGQKTTKTLSEK